MKAEGERLGMHIKGGLKGQRGNPLDANDEGVFISKINSSGAVRRDGRLKVGMRILEVNGQSLLGATHQEAVESLRLSANRLNMVVCKGFEKSDLIHGMISSGSRLGSRASETGSELSQSVSSLDREDFDSSTVIQNSHAENLLNKSDDVFVENEKETEAASTSEEITRLANEVALFGQTESSLVSAKEKSTPEKVKGFNNCSLAYKLIHNVSTGARHCTSRRVVGVGRHHPPKITRRSSRDTPEDNNHRHVEAHAEHNGTATAAAAGDASSSYSITSISGMSFLKFFSSSSSFFTHFCVIILLFETNPCLGSFQL